MFTKFIEPTLLSGFSCAITFWLSLVPTTLYPFLISTEVFTKSILLNASVAESKFTFASTLNLLKCNFINLNILLPSKVGWLPPKLIVPPETELKLAVTFEADTKVDLAFILRVKFPNVPLNTSLLRVLNNGVPPLPLK